jgi:hypothetical protein
MGTLDTAEASARPADAVRRALWLDLVVLTVVLAVACALRVHYFAGFGYGDDQIFQGWVLHYLERGAIAAGNQSYRFTWWIPTLWSVRALGTTELALVLPYLVYSLAGIAVVFLLARRLWGRAAAVIAALLLAVQPLDLVFSTMMANDIALSVFMALTVLIAFAACDASSETARRRWWMATAVALFLAYHSKVTGVLMFPVVGAIAVARRQSLASLTPLGWSVALLFGVDALVSLALSGTPLGPFQAEIAGQGLMNEAAAKNLAVSWDKMRVFPGFLFERNNTGTFVHGFYPHVLVITALLAWPLRLRVEWALWVWLAVVFLGMELNLQRSHGYWIVGYRNLRHSHVFVYPVVVLLAGYLDGVRRRWPGIGWTLVALVAATSAQQAVATGRMTRAVFADGRIACAYLADLPPGVVTTDLGIRWRCEQMPVGGLAGWSVQPLTTPDQWPRQLAHVRAGYVITGGGRRPTWHGGETPVPRGADVPAERASLLLQVPGPTAPQWRQEPLRIWYAWSESAVACTSPSVMPATNVCPAE